MGYKIYRNGDTPVIRGVLFDMDGLVLDTEKLYTRFWMEACHFYGFPMTREQALQMRSLGSDDSAAKLHGFFGEGARYPAIRDKRVELMESFIRENGVELKPGVFELLEELSRRGIQTAITSSSPMDRIRSYLSRHDLERRFDALCSGHDMARSKPAPDIYLHGAAILGLRPEECLALEDAPLGIEAAFRAGCIPVMIPDQDQPDKQTEEMLFAKADSLIDVIGLLK